MAEPDARMVELAAMAMAYEAWCFYASDLPRTSEEHWSHCTEASRERWRAAARAVLALPLLKAARELAEATMAAETNRGWSYDAYNAAVDRYRIERARLKSGS